jgi:hypothetical protein
VTDRPNFLFNFKFIICKLRSINHSMGESIKGYQYQKSTGLYITGPLHFETEIPAHYRSARELGSQCFSMQCHLIPYKK